MSDSENEPMESGFDLKGVDVPDMDGCFPDVDTIEDPSDFDEDHEELVDADDDVEDPSVDSDEAEEDWVDVDEDEDEEAEWVDSGKDMSWSDFTNSIKGSVSTEDNEEDY